MEGQGRRKTDDYDNLLTYVAICHFHTSKNGEKKRLWSFFATSKLPQMSLSSICLMLHMNQKTFLTLQTKLTSFCLCQRTHQYSESFFSLWWKMIHFLENVHSVFKGLSLKVQFNNSGKQRPWACQYALMMMMCLVLCVGWSWTGKGHGMWVQLRYIKGSNRYIDISSSNTWVTTSWRASRHYSFSTIFA